MTRVHSFNCCIEVIFQLDRFKPCHFNPPKEKRKHTSYGKIIQLMSRPSHLGQWGRPGHEAEAAKKRKQATQCTSRIKPCASIMWGENLKTLTNYVSNAAYKVKGLITQPGVHETSSTVTYKLTYTSLQAISNVTTD